MSIITFTVLGSAATKGRMKPIPGMKHGMTYSNAEKLAAWTADIKVAVLTQCGNRGAPTQEAVHIGVCWHVARPKWHWCTGRNVGKIKPRAPLHPTSKRTGDVDKLARALLDALTGIVYVDDSQVVTLNACKRYAIDTGPQMAVTVQIEEPA